MSNEILNTLQDGNFYTVDVTFQNQSDNRGWTYKVPNDVELSKGDKVIVPVASDDMFKVATVQSVEKNPNLSPKIYYRWVVQKLDTSFYEALLAHEEQLKTTLVQAERSKARKELVENIGGEDKLPKFPTRL